MELSLRRALKVVKKAALSGFPNVTAHFKRMLERPSDKKVPAYEKEVNEEFALPPKLKSSLSYSRLRVDCLE